MKVLHITPHLGGGIGKAHAAIAEVLPRTVEQLFLLLEEPRDSRFVALVEAAGSRVEIARDLRHIAEEAARADIVQIEFWNHPRTLECLARCPFPEMRSVFWAHISGVARPVIQPALIANTNRFVFSTKTSLTLPYLAPTVAKCSEHVAVINSGFGFSLMLPPHRKNGRMPRIAYVGTVDFIKMHPGFFSAIDALEGDDIHAAVWGGVVADGPVMARAEMMRRRDRVHFKGQTDAPLDAMRDADIFFYPLHPDHYGTAENALIEAMSIGLTPVVLNNPAEAAIITHGETGFICDSIEDCVGVLQSLLSDPKTLHEVGAKAAKHVEATRSPTFSMQQFVEVWERVLAEPARKCDFKKVLGDSPREWFFSTQYLPHDAGSMPGDHDMKGSPTKGTLAHFAHVFPDSDLASRN